MADSRLRNLERRWSETGSMEDEATFRREQLRVGLLSRTRATIAAQCGHPALRLALPDVEPITNWLSPQIEEDIFLLVAVLACRHFRRFWNLRLPIEDPVAWIESLGGKTHYWADEQFHQVRLQMMLDGEEMNGSVPMSRLTTAYPGFNNEPHWTDLLSMMRRRHYDNGRDYILEPLLWEIVDLVEGFRLGKLTQQALLGYGTFIVWAAIRTDAEWVSALWGMTQQNFTDNYQACLSACLSAEGTHEAINQGVIAWALT